jgi:hypothetical protein
MNYAVTELGPLSSNGQLYSEGQEVSIDDAQAQELIALGIVAPVGAKPKRSEKDA